MVPRIGLYYPYVHFRNEAWLKVAALYWPKLARIVPEGYLVRDNATTRALIDQLDFVINISPDSAKDNAGTVMLQAITGRKWMIPRELKVARPNELSRSGELKAISDNYTSSSIAEFITNDFDAIGSTQGVFGMLDVESYAQAVSAEYSRQEPVLAGLMELRLPRSLILELTHRRLAFREGPWLGMHPRVAWIYMCVLAEQIAAQNHLIPITDQQVAHSAAYEWNPERIIHALLGIQPSARRTEVHVAALGLLAIQLVVRQISLNCLLKKSSRFHNATAKSSMPLWMSCLARHLTCRKISVTSRIRLF